MSGLGEVARRAQVSKATASRVLNGLGPQHRISPQTIRAVEDAALALGYRGGDGNRAGRPQRPPSRTIGVLANPEAFAGTGADYANGILAGINVGVRTAGYHLLLNDQHRQWEALGIDLLAERRVDALIAFAWVLTPDYTLIDLDHLDLPLVVVGDPPRDTIRPVVMLSSDAAMDELFARLTALGHRRIGWIGSCDRRHPDAAASARDAQSSDRRARAVRDRATRLGVDMVEVLVGSAADGHNPPSRDALIETYLQDLRSHFSRLAGCTALLCYNDLIGITALRVLHELGEEVPRDRSVVGFDDFFADIAIPPLATISHRQHELGRQAAAIAIELARDPTAVARWAGRREQLQARFLPAATLGPTRT